MNLTPTEWRHLLHTPARYSRGAPGRDICNAMHGTTRAPAVDRTIAVLRALSDKGLVHAPNSIHTFARYFARGYRRTEAGESLVEQHQQAMEGAA